MSRKAARRVRRAAKNLTLVNQRRNLAYERLKRCEAEVKRLEQSAGKKD